MKKNQVESHFFRCRQCECLTCMDCQEEFWGNDFKFHVKCITENEKYGGKDYVPKPTSNKGEVKQEKWIEHIHSVLATKKISGPLSGVLKDIVTFSNIPRKKSKFENLLSNSLKIYDKKLISAAWEIFAEGTKKESGTSNEKASNINGAKDTGLSNGNSESSEKSTSTKRSADSQDDNPSKKIHLCQNNEESKNQSKAFDWCRASEEILQQYSSGLCEKTLRKQVIAKYKDFMGDSCSFSNKELKTTFRNRT